MTTDALADKFQKLGVPQADNSDFLSNSPIGLKGAPLPPPHAPGSSGDAPPPDQRLDHYAIAGGQPATVG